MAANNVAITPGAVKGFGGSITGAQTDKTGATAANIVTAYTATAAASSGQAALVQDITFDCPGTSAAAVICIFKNILGVRSLFKEVAVTAVTSSTTAIGYNSGKIVLNEWINPGDKIDVSSTIAQTTHFAGNAAEF